MDQDTYVSQAEAAVVTGLSVDTIRRRIADGSISAVRIGRLIRIRRSELANLGRPVTLTRRASSGAA